MASSGNSYGNCIGSVASSSLAITVASSNDMGTVNRNDDQFSAFSTFGPRTDLDLVNPTIGMLKPDITAPGTGIFSVQGESGNTADLYHSLSGTSMAAPFVSGAVALLIDLKYDIPPGAIKDLLKRTAFLTPDHIAGGASYPTIDTVYNVNWGYGLIDLYEAATQLSTGITDISFTDCVGAHPDYPNCRRCLLSGGKSTYQNNVDIQVATDPPVKGQPNIITVTVENRGGAPAYNVVVCVGANQLGIGLNEFYDVSCEEISVINDGATASISVPWTSILANHQCIKASIDYGFDTDYTNNHTQRNINAIDLTSNPGSANASFTVQNPLNEPADIVLRVESKVEDCPGQYGLAYLGCPLLEVNIYGVLIGEEFTMRPEDCPKLANLDITPTSDYLPPGYKATIDVGGRAYSDTHPKGIELPFRSNYDALPLNRLSESFSNIIMNSYL